MIFKKRKANQNKIKPPGRKRKIVATIPLAFSLLFGKARLSSPQSSSPNFGNQAIHERLIDDREFNLLEENDQQVILVRRDDSGAPSEENKFLISNSSDNYLILRGGSDQPEPNSETENREKGKLIQSIITKSSGYNYKSFNKIIKEVFSRFEPLLSNSTFWRIVHLARQPIEPTFVVEGAFTNSPLLNPKMQQYNNQCPRNFQDVIALSSDKQVPLVDTPTPQPTEKLGLSLSEEYRDFVNHLKSVGIENRFDTDKISKEKFIQLATDPFRKEITKQSIKEARTSIQAQLEGYIINPQRPAKTIAQIVDLDYLIDGPNPYTHFDPKDLVGSATLEAQGQSITIEEMAFNCGVKIAKQKTDFIGLHESAPKSPQNVLHAVNLGDIAVSEKETVKDFVRKGFKSQKNSIYGIIFLNE